MKLHDPVEIRWIDSFCSLVAWEDADEYETDCHDILTLGYFLSQNARFIVVVQSRGDDENTGQYGSIWRIPVGCCLSIRKLNTTN